MIRHVTFAWMILSVTGCPAAPKSDTDNSSPRKPTAQGEAAATAAAPTKDAESEWRRIPLDESDPKLARARAAKAALGGTLMSTLKAAVGSGDFAAGVKACASASGPLAEQVAAEHGVRIGRTSFKLRNPRNVPPDFAVPFVEDRTAEEVWLESSSGARGYLSPIRLKAPCVSCHGPADQLSAEVTSMLAETYPDDEATGFEVGDLRGWFWVEVPAEG